MPRYYFNVVDGQIHPDICGMTLDDPKAAQLEAIQFTGDMLVQAPGDFCTGKHWRLKVIDETDQLIFEINVHSKSDSAKIN